jgi:drug/metabolite transporter (DMT)-like permease
LFENCAAGICKESASVHSRPMISTPLAIAFLALIGTTFGANHIAARIAFDHGAGVLLAIAARSLLATLLLLVIVVAKKTAPQVSALERKWLLVAAALVAAQSVCVYTAVARVPVAIALLVFNLFPLFFVLLTWALNGKRPARATLAMVPVIFIGLALVLDIPALLRGVAWTRSFSIGIACAFAAAIVFSSALWVTENKLNAINGALRTLVIQAIVAGAALLAIASNGFPAMSTWPRDQAGVLALIVLAIIYATAFSTLFVMMPRLNLARNAPALNIEPVATLFLGWAILGQTFNVTQSVGAAVVVCAIIVMSVFKK